eukprot:TRINITY_DN65829_c0_g1_i1.p1 TRINITY_DN65829_c0_g1~~TRINITY_DN65829_c0_g1_i1.p1  ORF type:complete len:143 (-),score=38.26 TRINITY_DN65829_c0_g1_i1:69-497(-)
MLNFPPHSELLLDEWQLAAFGLDSFPDPLHDQVTLDEIDSEETTSKTVTDGKGKTVTDDGKGKTTVTDGKGKTFTDGKGKTISDDGKGGEACASGSKTLAYGDKCNKRIIIDVIGTTVNDENNDDDNDDDDGNTCAKKCKQA